MNGYERETTRMKSGVNQFPGDVSCAPQHLSPSADVFQHHTAGFPTKRFDQPIILDVERCGVNISGVKIIKLKGCAEG
jgi:hypothetical protein